MQILSGDSAHQLPPLSVRHMAGPRRQLATGGADIEPLPGRLARSHRVAERLCNPDRMAVHRQYSDNRTILAPDQRPRIRPSFTTATGTEPKLGEDATAGGGGRVTN